MFSLADQIEKFQKVILTMPDNVMTIDERFIGGGIKMQDLIQQNSFIINQMRKFKGVFLNYCKLNDKIYKKIIQHQVSANEHLNKMVVLSSAIDRKIEESDKNVKKTKQNLVMQMTKLNQFAQNGIKSIKDTWSNKVNQQNFPERVKKLIQQYQQQNASIPPSASDSQKKDPNSPYPYPASSKKRKGLTLQDIETFKAQITPLIDEVSQRVDNQNIKIGQCISQIQRKGKKICKVQQSIKWISQDILVIRKSIQQYKNFALAQDQKVVSLLREAINQNVWTQRFQNFNKNIVNPQIQKISIKLTKYIQTLKKQIDQTIRPKFPQLTTQISKLHNKQKSFQSKVSKLQQKSSSILIKIQHTKQQILKTTGQSLKKYDKIISQVKDQNISIVHRLQRQMQNMENKVDNIVNITQELVLRKVQNKLGREMKDIRGDIVQLGRRASQINNHVQFNKEQVGHVKDIVATKANYTDLIAYFDKKADKQQFKQLQQLFAQSPKQSRIESRNSNLHIDINDSLRRATQQKRKRKSSYSNSNYKRMATPLHTKPEQQSGRYLLVGWESPEKNSKEIFKSTLKNSSSKLKNKSVRPSTANTLFLL